MYRIIAIAAALAMLSACDEGGDQIATYEGQPTTVQYAGKPFAAFDKDGSVLVTTDPSRAFAMGLMFQSDEPIEEYCGAAAAFIRTHGSSCRITSDARKLAMLSFEFNYSH